MSAAITRHDPQDEAIELALVEGDLSRLSSAQRLAYYLKVCDSVGLNPLTKPFEYLRLNGKMLLYATKSCTDQLRATRGISLTIVRREVANGVCEVTARAQVEGREDTDVGAVFIDGLRGEALANAIMKAHTKAKRRVTLSICGLSLLDDSEVEAIRGAERVQEDGTPQVRQLPERTKSEPPPAMGPQDSFDAQLRSASTLAELKTVEQAIGRLAKAGKLGLERIAVLKDITKARRAELQRPPPEPAEKVLADNPMPEGWGGEAPQDESAGEVCLVCGVRIDAGGVPTHGNDGEVRYRHGGCSPFGVGREPGEEG